MARLGTPFLILSHHRSGSNFIGDLIQQHPSFDVLSEPFSMHTNVFRQIDLIPWHASDYTEPSLHDYLADFPSVQQFLYDLREYLSTVSRSETRGFKETMLFEKLPWIRQYIPDLKVIWLIRDPRAVVASIMKRNLYKLWDYHITIPRYLDDFDHDYPRGSTSLETPMKLCVWSWKLRYRLAEQHCDQFPHLVVKLEEMVQDPDTQLSAMMSFLGSAPHAYQRDFVRLSQLETRGAAYSTHRHRAEVLEDWKLRLQDNDRQYIESVLHDEMVQLGYI